MGLSNLPLAIHSLIDAGLPASTPAAAIQDGTTPSQQRLITTLDQLNDAIHGVRRDPVTFSVLFSGTFF